MTRPIRALVILSLTGLVMAACSPEPAPDNRRLVLVTQASGDASGLQAFAGEVRAREEVALSFRVPGKIAERLVDAGDRVKAGQVLARLDDADLRLQSQAASASVQALQADRDLAAAELKRYRELADKQLVSKSLYESRKAQADAAESRYRQALAQAKLSGNQAGYAEIRAPAAGIIGQRLAEAGQVVAAGQTVFVFAGDGARDIAISVAESHLATLATGQAVWVELWTQPGKRHAGKIREIAAAADATTRTYAVRVALDDADAPTQLGQSARVLFSHSQTGRLQVPMSALAEAGGKPVVWVFDPKSGRINARPVEVLGYGAQHAEVSADSLPAGQWLVQAGVHLLREGEAVRAVDADNRPVPAAKP